MTGPARGEVWLCALGGNARGAEAAKTRPVVVISINAYEHLPVRIIVPITRWQPEFGPRLNKVPINRTPGNGLERDSVADVLQVRAVSTERLKRKIGVLEADLVEEIAAGVAVSVGFPS